MLQGIQLALYQKNELAKDANVNASGDGFNAFTLAYNTHSEEEVDRLFAHFQTVGVSIVKKPEKAHWGGYSGYVADIDGHLWEIAFNPFLPLDKEGAMQL